MVKEISISGQPFKMDNSMWSHKLYLEHFGTDMFKDISNIKDLIVERKDSIDLAVSGELINVALQVAYAMIINVDETLSWKDFNKKIDNLQENSNWVLEVLGFATMFQGKAEKG